MKILLKERIDIYEMNTRASLLDGGGGTLVYTARKNELISVI
jgi:hypothetical protein